MSDQGLLEVEGLTVAYDTGAGSLVALDKVDFAISRGETLAIVGESGSGKSTATLAVMGLLGPEARVAGRMSFAGLDLAGLDNEARRQLRGRAMSLVFQDPFTSLNPSLPIGYQVAEPLIYHRGLKVAPALERAVACLEEVGLANAGAVARSYPHQLSGGMRQRVLIATALINDPELLILDEPTTALDVTIEAQILDLIEQIKQRRALAILYITHNLRVVARIADRVMVLYAGRVVETGKRTDVLERPVHPYTKGLLASLPRFGAGGSGGRLAPIGGRFPDQMSLPPGCIFAPRCPFAEARCSEAPQALLAHDADRRVRCWKHDGVAGAPWPSAPGAGTPARMPTAATGPLVGLNGIAKTYHLGGGLAGLEWRRLAGLLPWPRLRRVAVRAVDGVTLSIGRGEVLGLVGESGSGKSTLGRLVLRLVEPSHGRIAFAGEDITDRGLAELMPFRRAAQIVFQNPDSSLNPRRSVGDTIARAVTRARGLIGPALRSEVETLLDKVGLPRAYYQRFPHQLSGGEKQRVGIARALAPQPQFVVCDEPVSALDVSVQATVLNLLADLRDELGLSYLLISHDLGVVAHMADRIAVMYAGQIVEIGPTSVVLRPPYHPYTERLLSAAMPTVRRGGSETGDTPSAAPGSSSQQSGRGCPYAARCPRRLGPVCDTTPPPVVTPALDHAIACHIPVAELRRIPPIVPELANSCSA